MSVRTFTGLCMALSIASVMPALAFQAAPPAATVMPESEQPVLLTPDELRPDRLLPPPPAAGSATQLAELREIEALQQNASAGRRRQAVWDDRHEDASLFRPILGPGFDLATMPATSRLLSLTAHDAAYAAGTAKVWFARKRPWTYDSKIKNCETGPGAQNPLRSYPSGHATLGFALAVVLSDLRPDLAQPLLARAQDFAESRLICGVHYPSDIVASQALAMVVAAKVRSAPGLADLRAQAKAELAKAVLTPQAQPQFPEN